MGNIDRVIRLTLGSLIIAFGLYYQSWWGAAGLIPLITAIVEYCPLYDLLGISTNRRIQKT